MARAPRPASFWDTLFAGALPKTHLIAALAVAVALALLLALVPADEVSADRETRLIELAIPQSQTQERAPIAAAAPTIESEPAQTEVEPVATPAPQPAKQALTWREARVKSGDSLSILFKRLDLSPADVYRVANADGEARALRKIRPGETIAVALDGQGELAQVEYRRSALESFHYHRSDNGFVGEKMVKATQAVPAYRQVSIEHSLFLDGAKAGLENELIMRIAKIFGWDIDFALDIRKGDAFAVMFEEEYLDGVKIGNGRILAAEFTNRGERFQAVRYEKADGSADYFTPDGRPMRKAFLRAPLDFTRVSSNFNPNRLHPVFKTKRPHRGVDYAASTGTPVYASGDGKVIEAGYTRANGNYVFIRHGQAIVTKYLHLHRKAVKRGQTVKQGQKIGTVGSTGYATGPHLHYEFVVSGVHRNPRTVDLPEAEPIAESERARFAAQTRPLMTQLASYRQTQYAALSD